MQVDQGPSDLSLFTKENFDVHKPLKLGPELYQAPASKAWFQTQHRAGPSTAVSFSDKVRAFSNIVFPYEEVTNAQGHQGSNEELARLSSRETVTRSTAISSHKRDDGVRFSRYDAPLSYLLQAMEFNNQQLAESARITQLYIAQSSLDDLPDQLREDLAVPNILSTVMGKGDIYASSVWLGLSPTYTPLHRDPNPNLFHQMVDRKIVRLLDPARGKHLFEAVRANIGHGASFRFRGEEMMRGPERAALLDAVWGDNPPDTVQEAEVGPGESLYIPNGWWHSVRSVHDDGRLNASVNWWFR